MKVSVVVTVLNEETSVSGLLDSLLSQSKHPDEIVVVDGGSQDSTVGLIKSYQEKHKNIALFVQESNIAKGRNLAISKAKYDIIAQIDGGCRADKYWLERITKPFSDSKVGVVAGFYEMMAHTPLQQAVAPFHGVPPMRFDPRCYLPSGRSMAFRKSVWKEIGGYSEDLQWAGEDTLFNYHLVKKGIKIVRVPEAFVRWDVPNGWLVTAKKFYAYALGDAQTGIWWHPSKNLATHNIKIVSIYLRYLTGTALLALTIFNPIFLYFILLGFVLYTTWSIWKMRDVVNSQTALFLVPVVQIISDLSIMTGFLSGLLVFRKSPKSKDK